MIVSSPDKLTPILSACRANASTPLTPGLFWFSQCESEEEKIQLAAQAALRLATAIAVNERVDICEVLQAVATGTLHMQKEHGHEDCALSWLARACKAMFPVPN